MEGDSRKIFICLGVQSLCKSLTGHIKLSAGVDLIRCRDCLKVTKLNYSRCPKCKSTNVGLYYSASARKKDTQLGTDWRSFDYAKGQEKRKRKALWPLFAVVLPPLMAFSFLSLVPIPANSDDPLSSAEVSRGSDYNAALVSGESLQLRETVLTSLLDSMAEVQRRGITETEDYSSYTRVDVWDPKIGDHFLYFFNDEEPEEISVLCCERNPYATFEFIYDDVTDARVLFRQVGPWIELVQPDKEFSARIQLKDGLVLNYQDMATGSSSSFGYGVSEEYRQILIEEKENFRE